MIGLDPQGQARLTAFLQALALLGWTDGINVRIYTRWAAGDPDRFRRYEPPSFAGIAMRVHAAMSP
jgi:hypothetical protein